jgi:hypothetical protein
MFSVGAGCAEQVGAELMENFGVGEWDAGIAASDAPATAMRREG